MTLDNKLLAMLIILLGGCSKNNELVEYTDFLGKKSDLVFLESEEIVLFYPDQGYDRKVLKDMMETYDSAYRFFLEVSGRAPVSDSIYEGKLSFAIVPVTCGPGCGKLGAKGIEITSKKFDAVYRLFADSTKHDHIFFYELGRNFWFYEENLTINGSPVSDDLRTGFAVFMRNVIIGKLNIEVGDINGVPFEKYLQNNDSLLKNYTGEGIGSIEMGLLRKGKLFNPASNQPNLWAEFLGDFYEESGYSLDFLKSLLVEFKNQKTPSTKEEIFLNLNNAANEALSISRK